MIPDTSKIAYCAAVFIVSNFSEVKVARLMTAKTRLPALRKEMSILRL